MHYFNSSNDFIIYIIEVSIVNYICKIITKNTENINKAICILIKLKLHKIKLVANVYFSFVNKLF